MTLQLRKYELLRRKGRQTNRIWCSSLAKLRQRWQTQELEGYLGHWESLVHTTGVQSVHVPYTPRTPDINHVSA